MKHFAHRSINKKHNGLNSTQEVRYAKIFRKADKEIEQMQKEQK
ncbi:YfhE family protein [Thalassorhabdus alkalitolerans]|uniref:YfhE family protein n=1 Tax=Thalassorhabdus alkalitolerans TaxID=2282697 RepID=A0ABW0YSF4_9BACI|nr:MULTISPECIES: YfhE family protein [Bacillaceae]